MGGGYTTSLYVHSCKVSTERERERDREREVKEERDIGGEGETCSEEERQER